MGERISHYKSALYLMFALVVTELVLYLYLFYFSSDVANRATIRVLAALLVLLGLWLLSRITRYLGAVWLLFSAGVVVWQMFSIGRIVFVPALVWGIVLAAFSVALCWLLLFSKQFGIEFSERRRTEPRYKAMMRRTATAIVVLAAILATAIDIVHLARM